MDQLWIMTSFFNPVGGIRWDITTPTRRRDLSLSAHLVMWKTDGDASTLKVRFSKWSYCNLPHFYFGFWTIYTLCQSRITARLQSHLSAFRCSLHCSKRLPVWMVFTLSLLLISSKKIIILILFWYCLAVRRGTSVLESKITI